MTIPLFIAIMILLFGTKPGKMLVGTTILVGGSTVALGVIIAPLVTLIFLAIYLGKAAF